MGLAAVSVDTPERSAALAEQLGLPFSLLCDPAREAVRAFGVLNEKEKGGIAYPSTFVLDREPPRVGEIAPDFTLVDTTGAPRRLAEMCAERPLVLVFYGGHW